MIYTIENENLKVVLSSFAGGIESIVNKHTGNEHFWHYDSAFWPRRTPVCFPICGSLIDNEYIYKEETYTMPMHGFLREKELSLVEINDTCVVLQLVSDAETRSIYPFDFRFTLTERLKGDCFIVHYTVENTGDEDMYFSTGSHYTYNVPITPNEKMQGDYEYYFGAPQIAGKLILENSCVAGKTDDIFHGSQTLDLKDLFENGSTILEMKDIQPRKIAIRSKKSGAATEVAFEGFDYCVLWAPKGEQPFACIEPWTGMVDKKGHDKDITKKLGITKLSAKESRVYTQIITLK